VARGKSSAASTIVVHPCDETSLRRPDRSAQAGIIVPIWSGRPRRFLAVRAKHGLRITVSEIVDVPTAERPR